MFVSPESSPGRNFYPRPPRGGRPSFCSGWTISSRFLSTPSARRATLLTRLPVLLRTISIHALREEGDARSTRRFRPKMISIHALREEGDRFAHPAHKHRFEFLSTPSARRATTGFVLLDMIACYFYPRPPRGGRPSSYPHSLIFFSFLSTPSARRATTETGFSGTKVLHFYPRPPRGGRPPAVA